MRNIITDQHELTKKSLPIYNYEREDIFFLLKDALPKDALGLSAPQIGILKNAFIAQPEQGILIYFTNPIIDLFYDEYETVEGCLSIPNKLFKVQRFLHIGMRDDIRGTKNYTNKLAQIIQHEYDHLLGKTLLQTGKEIK